MIDIGNTSGKDGKGFTPAERNALIRYAVSIGTRAKLRTRVLLRPLKMKDLQEAFEERELFYQREDEKLKKQREEYDPSKIAPDSPLANYFGKVPSKEEYGEYCSALIWQCNEASKRIRLSYSVFVENSIPNKLMKLHRSLNPRVSFGYSNILHEECDFELTDEIKKILMNASLKTLPYNARDLIHDFGYVIIGDEAPARSLPLCYEDLYVYSGNRNMLYCLSHERQCGIDFTEDELNGFLHFDGKEETNRKIINKIKGV